MNLRIMRHVQGRVGSGVGDGVDGGGYWSCADAAGGEESSACYRGQTGTEWRTIFLAAEQPNPEVRAYLEEENAYTDAVMKPTEAFQKKLYAEMLGRIKETDVEVPYKEGDYFYYTRTEAGKQYAIRCRRKGSMGRGGRSGARRE